jgi:RNA polymerase sigma-70 factor (sigma-E family)
VDTDTTGQAAAPDLLTRFTGVGAGRGGRSGTPGARRAAETAIAVTELFRSHHVELVRLAMMVTGDLATAEDVVQDVFERMHRRWPALRDAASGLAYARASVLNGCRSAHRRNAVRHRHEATIAGRAESGPDAESVAADRGLLVAALRGLPGRQREVLVLRYYCDLDVAEIAAMLRIGPSAVRSTMSRGLAALARAVGEEGR